MGWLTGNLLSGSRGPFGEFAGECSKRSEGSLGRPVNWWSCQREKSEERIMQISDEAQLSAPRGLVRAALNNPEILTASIPGCIASDTVSDTEFATKATAMDGPINVTFMGKVILSNVEKPERYKRGGEGQGGLAGFAREARRLRSVASIQIVRSRAIAWTQKRIFGSLNPHRAVASSMLLNPILDVHVL